MTAENKEEARKEAQENSFKLKWLLSGPENIGLGSEDRIYQLFLKRSNMPGEMPYRSGGISVKSSENYKNRQIYGDKNIGGEVIEMVKISSGLPLIILGFGDFMTLQNLLKGLKIPKDTKKFEVDLANAVSRFIPYKGNSSTNKQIVFEVKQLIARIYLINTNIDHLYEEFWRGSFCPTVTTRPRTLPTSDGYGAALIPMESNKIKSYVENSNLPVSEEVEAKRSGIVEYSSSLYRYNTQDDLFRSSLVLALQPERFGFGDKTRRDNVTKILGINKSDIDLSNDQLIKGNNLMFYGALVEAEKLYVENVAEYNLPLRLEVTLLDHTIRLENCISLMSGTNWRIFKNVQRRCL